MNSLDNEISLLCQSCGFCCEGTLFDNGKIILNEDANILNALGESLYYENKNRFFKMPCCHFNKICTVYDQGRPSICGKYNCAQINKLKGKEVAVQEVQDLIEKVKKIRMQFYSIIENKYPELKGMHIHAIRKLMQNYSNEEEERQLKSKYVHLYIIGFKLFPLLNSFSEKKQKE